MIAWGCKKRSTHLVTKVERYVSQSLEASSNNKALAREAVWDRLSVTRTDSPCQLE